MPILTRDQHICVQIDYPGQLERVLRAEEEQPMRLLLKHLAEKQFTTYVGGSIIKQTLFGLGTTAPSDIDIFAVGEPAALRFIPLETKVAAKEYWFEVPGEQADETLEFLAFNEREGFYAGITRAAINRALPRVQPFAYGQPITPGRASEPLVKSYHLLPKRYTKADGTEITISPNNIRRIDLSLLTPERWQRSEYQH